MRFSFIVAMCVLSFALYSCTVSEEPTPPSLTGSSDIILPEKSISEKEKNQQIVKNKIETIRKRLALKGLIIDGDAYYRERQLTLALTKYQDFYKQNSEDDLIKKKIADTYFEMKKFSSALNYYKKIQNRDASVNKNLALSLWYTRDLSSPVERNLLQNELEELFPKGDFLNYYTISLGCVSDFHICKSEFNEYFWPKSNDSDQYEIIGENTGNEEIKNIEYDKLSHIKESIENYRNFKLDDVSLKNAYIVGAYFSDEMYNLSIILGKSILEGKPGYKPILKIIAQSYFELGDYENARKTLSEYYKNDDDDPAIAYMLGVVNTKLKDYVLSNIYFSKALSLGYTPSVNVYRQLVHNYYTLENEEKIRSTFKDMVKFEENMEAIDLSLGIYYHILGEDYNTALVWAKKGQSLFPDVSDFYGYEGWIYREQGKIEVALGVLERGLELDEDNAFLIINLGYTMVADNKNGAGLIYFKRIIKDFPETEFAIIAQDEINKISQK